MYRCAGWSVPLLFTSNKTSFFLTHHNWASTRGNLSSGFANNKGADQPAHPRSLISTFAIRLLENIISRIATGEISIF